MDLALLGTRGYNSIKDFGGRLVSIENVYRGHKDVCA